MAAAAVEVRDLGYIAWRDPRAWMESMKGARWAALVKRENQNFQEALEAAISFKDLKKDIGAFDAAQKEEARASSWRVEAPGAPAITLIPEGGGSWSWTLEGKRQPKYIGDLDIAGGGGRSDEAATTTPIILYSTEIGKGGNRYEIVAQKGGRVLWKRGGFGPSFAALGNRVYLLKEESVLRYSHLVSVDLLTGRGDKVLYDEKDRSASLDFVKGDGGCLFLLSDSVLSQKLFCVEAGLLTQLSPEASHFYPVGYGPGEGGASYFYKVGGNDGNGNDGNSPWLFKGDTTEFKVPSSLKDHIIEVCNLRTGLLVYIEKGERVFYNCKRGATELKRGYCFVETNPWGEWFRRGAAAGVGVGVGTAGAPQAGPLELLMNVPGHSPFKGAIGKGGKLFFEKPHSIYGGEMANGVTKGGAGWLVCWDKGQAHQAPDKLMVTVYGAYGLSTSLSTSRWKPYLESGWAIGFAFVRGGGDDTMSWADAGKRGGKADGVHDFIACIEAMQSRLRIPAKSTCIFGRSAGGYIIGAATALWPEGQHFGTVYAEAPYVDILRTSTNPALPLTEYEYLEFGNPLKDIGDLETMLSLSPVDALGREGAPGVAVVCRTAQNDKNVFAYESLKWVDALRGEEGQVGQKVKLVSVTGDQSHFVIGEERGVERAEDFALLSKICS